MKVVMDALDEECQHFDKDALPADTPEQDGSSLIKRTLCTAMYEMST
jgi:hypothetical protein